MTVIFSYAPGRTIFTTCNVLVKVYLSFFPHRKQDKNPSIFPIENMNFLFAANKLATQSFLLSGHLPEASVDSWKWQFL